MATTSTPTEPLTNLMCYFLIFVFGCLYNSIAIFSKACFPSVSFNAAIKTFGRFLANRLC